MNKFNFRKRNLLSGPHLLGTLLIIAGLFAIVSPMFLKSDNPIERILAMGVGAVILGLLIVSSYSGTLIDFTKKKYKEYLSIFGYQFGEWIVLPNISKVRVIAVSYLSTNTPNGISPTLSGKVIEFKTMVYSSTSKPEFSFVYSNRDKALKHAKLLASNLNASLKLDIAERE
ncbi:MAG: hypothetical protein RIC35_05815 [Marinoscillum sp.]